MIRPPTPEDIDLVARTAWGEARGEGELGMEAVAAVIRNRVYDPERWAQTYDEVCLAPNQFSCWRADDLNRQKAVNVNFGDVRFFKAFALAASVMAMIRPIDPTHGANHYLTEFLFMSGDRPTWADPKKLSARIGNHVFLRL